MKWDDIKETFKDEWVLVEVEKVDKYFYLIEGKVLAHSKDKDKIYKKLLEIKPKEFMIEYTGKIPEDIAVVLMLRLCE